MKLRVVAQETIIAYHESREKFKKFDLEFAAQGILWFTEDKEKVINKGTGGSGHNYIYTVNLNVDKVAGWEEYNKLMLGQIKEHFDSIKLDDDWIIFDPDNVTILSIEENR